MQIVTTDDKLSKQTCDLLCIGIFANTFTDNEYVAEIDKLLDFALEAIAHEHDFSGKAKQQVLIGPFAAGTKSPARRIALIGLGRAEDVTANVYVHLGAQIVQLGNSVAAKHVLLAFSNKGLVRNFTISQQALLLSRGIGSGTYRFDRYKHEKSRPQAIKKITLKLPAGKKSADISDMIQRGSIVSHAAGLVRDWVNQSPGELYPEIFAKDIEREAHKHQLQCTVLKPTELLKKKMHLLLAVGEGSVRPPRLVHLSYTPKGTHKKAQPVVLVGKGITFDAGGLCLKTADGMFGMKMDMAGAATVVGTILALAQLQVDYPVHAIVALAENMPSGSAYRPGDVVTSAAGKTVEIVNTDAEGRLVLADALHYALDLAPQAMIDVATLTGACMIALGAHTAGLFSNDDKLAEKLLQTAKQTGEDVWHMPLTPKLLSQLKSDVADLRNTGERYGGAITAALFLKEFVADVPWAHLDIAGPAYTTDSESHGAKGATAMGLSLLVEFIASGAAYK